MAMYTSCLVLNLIVSFASVTAALLALRRPASLSRSGQVSAGELFYAHMYAARSVPFGAASALLPFWPGGKAVACLLFTAAVIQLLDATIALRRRDGRMAIGASIGATIHVITAFVLL